VNGREREMLERKKLKDLKGQNPDEREGLRRLGKFNLYRNVNKHP